MNPATLSFGLQVITKDLSGQCTMRFQCPSTEIISLYPGIKVLFLVQQGATYLHSYTEDRGIVAQHKCFITLKTLKPRSQDIEDVKAKRLEKQVGPHIGGS